ncbi:hypothetical protein EUX98_g7642 [Antrodiella citrinella]|uniref:F-box domain-containing protein n=1 Tax=Antrodiella citrinella TaxID=2447956 RepID=A0A4S4MLK2_9APHY|nr:hypothetical protein EUX98_g7642 [Antrodiella citrinella]
MATSGSTFQSLIFLILHDFILYYLPPADIFALGRTNRDNYLVVEAYVKRFLDINRYLLPYFPDLDQFRSLQARCQFLVSGSTVLQVFTRTRFSNPDLDLYVSLDFCDDLTAWLVSNGYGFQPTEWQPPSLVDALHEARSHDADFDAEYAAGDVQAVLNFFKPASADTHEHLKVQCVVVKTSPFAAILSFHSMSCLFPRATTSTYRTLVFNPHGQLNALAKYVQRGYKLVEPPFPLSP